MERKSEGFYREAPSGKAPTGRASAAKLEGEMVVLPRPFFLTPQDGPRSQKWPYLITESCTDLDPCMTSYDSLSGDLAQLGMVDMYTPNLEQRHSLL